MIGCYRDLMARSHWERIKLYWPMPLIVAGATLRRPRIMLKLIAVYYLTPMSIFDVDRSCNELPDGSFGSRKMER